MFARGKVLLFMFGDTLKVYIQLSPFPEFTFQLDEEPNTNIQFSNDKHSN
jgi:hypothetical protein